MSWSGPMTCQVYNETSGPITQVQVSHEWNGGTQQTQPAILAQLAPNQYTSFQITTGSGSNDNWSVQFFDATGQCYTRQGKQCNLEESDYDSNNPVKIVLRDGDTGFDIIPPVSSACTGNAYDTC